MGPTRVLIVDDSAFARKVLREVLATSSSVEVVGYARDGLEALESIAELDPDVVTLDLLMPNLDGIGVLRELSTMSAKAKVVVVSISDEKSELVVEALQLGAVEIVRKPTALATDRLYELKGDLLRAVATAHASKSPPAISKVAVTLPHDPASLRHTTVKVVVLGTSTGGPQALTRLLSGMPATFPVPILMGLHIPGDYTEALANRLNALSALEVVEARDGLRLRAGLAVLARGGLHLKVERDGTNLVAKVTAEPATSLYAPSINVLFGSAVTACGGNVLGVVLTGMGDDGLVGSAAIVAAGGRVLTEAESSCVIYGMPRSIQEAGYSSSQAPIDEMAGAIVRALYSPGLSAAGP